MRSTLLWRAGSAALALAGALGVVGIVLERFDPTVWTGIWLAAAARLVAGVALAATGVAMGRRLPACVLLMVGGGLLTVLGVADLLVAGLVVAPGWTTIVITVLAHLGLLAAAIATAARGGLPGTASWALVMPAIALVALDQVSWLGIGIPLWWAACLVEALLAAVGVVWVRVVQPSAAVTATTSADRGIATVTPLAAPVDAAA